MSVRDLDALLRPASIALVLSEGTPDLVRARVVRNLVSGGFEGAITLVGEPAPSERVASVDGIDQLAEGIDLAVLAVPRPERAAALSALGARGTRATAILTTGFHETQSAAEHAALCAAAGPMRVLGPDVLALMVPGIGLNAGYSHIWSAPGDLALIAQSGTLVTSVLDWATPRDIGFSHMISIGGQADVDFGDLLDYLTTDPSVRGILLSMQGIVSARKFMSAARAAARAKPVVVIKSGDTEDTARATASHSVALAGRDAVYDAAIRRAGMLRVGSMAELFSAVETLSSNRRVPGPRLAIVSNGGGIGIITADAVLKMGGRLAEPAAETLDAVTALLPHDPRPANPFDIKEDADGARYRGILEALAEDRGVDAILALYCPTAVGDGTETARAVASLGPRPRKAIFTSWIGGRTVQEARRLLSDAGLPTYDTANEAARAFIHWVRYQENQKQLMQVPSVAPAGAGADRAAVRTLIDGVLKDGREWLSEAESKAILSSYGLPVVETRLCADAADAVVAASELGEPVAVKIASADIQHKSMVGGVALDVETPSAAGSVAEAMLARIARDFPDARIDGITVQRMARRPGAHELLLAMVEDSLFGPVVLFGAGGKAAEALGDTAIGMVPLNQPLAEALIDRTRIARLLQGYSDVPPAARADIVHALVVVSQLAADFAEIKELDINPLLADADGVIALDARIKVAAADGDAHDRLSIMPYPNRLERTLALKDGSEVPVRPIRPDDAPRLQRSVQESDPEDLRMRFLHPVRTLPDLLAARLSQIDYSREMSFAALQPDDHDRIIGVTHLAADPDGLRAEYAIMLRSDMKGRGLGRIMMKDLIGYARERGIAEIFGEVLAENRPMLTLCRNLGFAVRPAREEPGVMSVVLPVAEATF